MKRLSTIFLLLSFLVATAPAQTNLVKFTFDHKAGPDTLILNQTVFSIWNNKKVMLSRAEFYVSELEILLADSSKVPLTDQYLLVNANNPAAEFALGTWPIDAAYGITLHLGVPATANHSDPASYPPNHPLAPQNPTMHWGWSAGYRFMAIEGKVDNNGDGVPETVFEFHNLFDELYRAVELTAVKEAENGVLHLHFILDYVQLFKNMAMTGTLINHGKFANNVAMMNNAATQHFVTVDPTTAAPEVKANSLNIKSLPNPANDVALLEYTLPAASGKIDLVLFNALGQRARSHSGLLASGSFSLETALLPAGIYYCAFYEGSRLVARKQLIIKH